MAYEIFISDNCFNNDLDPRITMKDYITEKMNADDKRVAHDDVIKWKHFPRYWPFVRGIHRSPVNSPHKGQWRGALIYSLICVWKNGWVNNRGAGDLRRYRARCDVTVMIHVCFCQGFFFYLSHLSICISYTRACMTWDCVCSSWIIKKSAFILIW